MALGPLATHPLDDGTRIDEHAVEIKEERCRVEFHTP